MKGVFSTELKEIEQMIIQSKYQESSKRLDNLLNRKELLEEEIIQAKILKAMIFLDIQPFYKALINAKQAYEESVKIGDTFLIFDSAMAYARSSSFLGIGESASEKMKHAIEVLEKYEDQESHDYLKRKARILTYGVSSSEKYMDKIDQSIDIFEQVGDDYQKAWSLFGKASAFFEQGDHSKGGNYYNQSLKIFTELGNIVGIIACTINAAAVFIQRGELDEYLRYSLKGLSYAEEIDSSYILDGIYADLGFYYWQKGELETSLQYYKKSLGQIKRGKLFGNRHYLAVLFRTNLVYLEQGKYEEIKQNLEKMEIVATIRSLQDASVVSYPLMHIYRLAQSIYLKELSFDDNQDKIERMLKEIVQEKLIYIEMNRMALFHLCDFYLRRLKQTNDLELLLPLKQTIDQLDELAEKQKSSILLAETYLLKSHLALIELKVEEAKTMLEKAQRIADEKGITRLATLISNEYDHLLEQISSWESFTAKLPNIADRMELTHLEDMMNKLVKNRISFADVSHENEDPSIFLIMDKTGHVVFSDNFEDIPLENDLVEGIITTIHDFLEEKEPDKNTSHRLQFRNFGIVLYQSEDMLLSYVFVGKSYSAVQKINKLITDFSTFSEIWGNLSTKINSNQELSLSDRTRLSDYLETIFV
ncbi:MAG: tetratricopeptide repeat protein [Candidatus Heimdallarchaeota archaeon]|nr:tetratricopeptide repeat protein [Candidatus Heimdallarchaeota archaeon]MCG3256330.1 tetratricopeptide repeat protein [Candidatus Heimdallarchaeota archaeon]MCK4611398.1 tetratricopeptide repeat protein [Candidatus Heimdallarchaeota archaeon]